MARIVDWETFFASAAGCTVAAWEKGAYARFVSAKLGTRALQIGLAKLDPLEKSPIAHRIALTEEVEAIAGEDLRVQVLGSPWALPFEDECCDIVALPHGFDLPLFSTLWAAGSCAKNSSAPPTSCPNIRPSCQ